MTINTTENPEVTLEPFHPVVRRWFIETYGEPTPVQTAAWPVIARGEHVLVTAPTGSGKTLTAFMWALDRLLTGAWSGGGTRVLYISPLKALNNDIQRNLLEPLAALRARFEAEIGLCPDVQVMTRSGDTEQKERQRMLRKTPEILITTPESLNLMLSSRRAQGIFRGLNTVILDEIHAVAGSKRGIHLMTAVDRLVRLSGEFQRIAISATVRPLERVATLVGGYALEGDPAAARYTPRPVALIAPPARKVYDVSVRFPEPDESTPNENRSNGVSPFLPRLAGVFRELIRNHRSTLLFTNNRRLCERMAMLINEDEDEMLAYSHHGSLSREMRAVVEQRLKQGELRAIVATSSLELGIDIGALDQVVLVETPLTVASALQRIGRAGHQVGAVSKGALFPTHGRDLIDAAVMARCLVEQDIEELVPPEAPLDVLAQVLVSMIGIESWDLDRLYAFVRTSAPYHHLSRRQFDLVIEMLAGRYEDSRLRALRPLASVDRIDHTIAARDGALRLIYSSGGTIPDRGYYILRRADTRAKIGELDEEFVWERRVGDVFTLGMQSWRIQAVTHNDVLVDPAPSKRSDVPFWRAEDLDRPFSFADRIASFLEEANEHLEDPAWTANLESNYALDAGAVDALRGFLKRQRATTQADLPHRHHVLGEYSSPSQGGEGTSLIILHTLWGGKVTRPLAFVLAQAMEEATGLRIDVFAGNDCVVAIVPSGVDLPDPWSVIHSEAIEELLRRRLEQTGFFGARFRENAARALLLPRNTFGNRMPLWFNRQRSKKLLDTIGRYEDFPILIETWRECLHDDFDLPTLRLLLDEVRTGAIRVTETTTAQPSPFAEGSLWRVVNLFMYQDDTPDGGRTSNLSDDLLKEAVFSAELRPHIDRELVCRFVEKAQRTFPGYAPGTPEELLDWVKERLLLPETEWQTLLDAIERDHGIPSSRMLRPIATKLALVQFTDDSPWMIAAMEMMPRILGVFERTPDSVACRAVLRGADVVLPDAALADEEEADRFPEWLSEWIRFYGPIEREALFAALPLEANRVEEAIETLVEARAAVLDHLTEPGDRLEVCDSENVEILLRMTRAAARPRFDALPIEALPLFLAQYQRLMAEDSGQNGLQRALEPLFGYPIPADLFETEILPARVAGYHPALLDTLTQESDLMWFGTEGRRIVLCFRQNRELFVAPAEGETEQDALWQDIASRLFADPKGQYYFDALLDHTKLNTGELIESLWEFVWQGRITNDTFAALRKGLETRFREPVEHRQSPTRRARFAAWKSARTYPGAWRQLAPPEIDGDLIDQEELNRERVRMLLDRYGVLFRELLTRELPCMRWSTLFPTLRQLELAGEILAGSFFHGIPGIQFATPEALQMLQRPLPEDRPFWLNAADPASLCGVDLPALKQQLPSRRPTTHLGYWGQELIVVSRRSGKDLDIRVEGDDPRLEPCLAFLHNLLSRAVHPVNNISIETIKGEKAIRSPYVTWLREFFDVSVDSKRITLWKTP